MPVDAGLGAPTTPGPTAPDGEASPPPEAALGPLPATFGRYELRQLLGRGGMGAVYLAHDTQLDRPVALKVPTFGNDELARARERFLREARAAARLRHPHLCPVYDAGEIGAHLYLSMAYVAGEPLAHRIRRDGPLPPNEAAALARAIALGMQEAHSHGVIHRDLKPGNVMLDEHGQPVITDFGLARRLDGPEELRLTQRGAVVGTPAYMAPEQAEGQSQDLGPACDIYGLGVILYEMLTGRLPFRAERMGQLLAQIQRDPPTPPGQLRPGLDRGLETVCLRALAKRPEDRFTSMSEFADALAPFTLAAPVAATVTVAPPRRRRWPLVAVAALLLALLGGAALYTAHVLRTDETPETAANQREPAAVKEKPAKDKPDPMVAAREEKRKRQKLARLLFDGNRLLDVGRHREALAVAEQALALDPQSPGALAVRAMARAAADMVEEARDDCEAALKLNPETALAYLTRGILAARLRRVDDAIADTSVVIRLRPRHATAYSNRAFYYFRKKEYRQSLADANAALTIRPTYARALGNRAAAYLALGRLDESRDDLTKAIALEPTNGRYHWGLAQVHQARDAVLLAREEQRKAEALDPSFKGRRLPTITPVTQPVRAELSAEDEATASRLLEQATVADKRVDYQGVLPLTAEVLRLDPWNPRALDLRANALFLLARPDEAMEAATSAVRANPSSWIGYLVLGGANGQRREWAKGIAYLTISVTLKPDYASAWNNRSHAYYNLGMFHQALADAEQALKYAKHPGFLVNRAVAYVGLGEYRKALADLDAAVAMDRFNPMWYEHRSAVYGLMGDLGKSKVEHERALQLAPAGAKLPALVLPRSLPPPRVDPELEEAPAGPRGGPGARAPTPGTEPRRLFALR
jgi:tetratricopeptide (TPR) repeat protein